MENGGDNNINEQNKEKINNKLNNNQPFCEEFAGVIGVDLFKKEQKNELSAKKLIETVLEKKISEKTKDSINSNNFIQSEEINELQKSLNISLTDENKLNNEYLQLREFPQYDINEYDKIKKRVGKNLLNISDFLLNKKLKFSLNEINPHKKIGPLLPLTTLIEGSYSYKPELKNEMQKKYFRLKNYVCNCRTIYGDGNCYYRAVMFRYIELLIVNKKSDFIKLLILDINNCYSDQGTKLHLIFNRQQINSEIIIQILIIIYELVENNNILEAYNAFYKAILCSKDFDFLLIFYLRFILKEYIKKNEKKLYLKSFPVLIGNLLPSIYEKDGVFDFDSFYQNYLLKMFIPAEKIIIYLTPFVLGMNLEIVLFDDNEKDIVKHFKYYDIDKYNEVKKQNILDIKQTIFLINRKNHYEIAFNYFDNKNYNYIYSFYRNDIRPHFIKEEDALSNLYNKIKSDSNNSKKNDKYKKEENINDNKNNQKKNIDNNIDFDFNKNKERSNKNIKKNNLQNNVINCIVCSSPIYIQNKTIKDICQKCLFNQTFIQIKKFYIDYIKLVINKIGQVTRNDLNNLFLDKIKINIFEKTLNINQLIEEMEFSNKIKSYLNQLMTCLKQGICLYCLKDINNQNSHLQLPCGCTFCSVIHLNTFFKNIVKNRLSYNYKCICAIEYKPYQTFQLCNFLKQNKIYDNNENYIKHLSYIFSNLCCKCGQFKNKIIPISVDNAITNFHKICEDCIKMNNINNNNTLQCIICNKTHKYI